MKILRRIARVPEQQQMDRLAQLLILSGLRKAEVIVEKERRKMSFEVTIENNSYLRKIHLEGEKRGRMQVLQLLLKEKFGELPDWAEKKIEAANTAAIKRWTLRLIDAKHLEDVFPKPRAARLRRKQ